MNDYGFKPYVLFGLTTQEGVEPKTGDVYNPLNANGRKGNTNTSGGKDVFNWNIDTKNNIDLRLYYYTLDPADSWSEWRFSSNSPRWWRKNVIEDVDICYGSEALRYAQAAYLVSIVIVQIADLLICKTRNLSLMHQGIKNNVSNFGIIFWGMLGINYMLHSICKYWAWNKNVSFSSLWSSFIPILYNNILLWWMQEVLFKKRN